MAQLNQKKFLEAQAAHGIQEGTPYELVEGFGTTPVKLVTEDRNGKPLQYPPMAQFTVGDRVFMMPIHRKDKAIIGGLTKAAVGLFEASKPFTTSNGRVVPAGTKTIRVYNPEVL